MEIWLCNNGSLHVWYLPKVATIFMFLGKLGTSEWNITLFSFLLPSCLDQAKLPIMTKVLVLSFPLLPLMANMNIFMFVHGCVCKSGVSSVLPSSDGFGLNNVIIKAFAEPLPALLQWHPSHVWIKMPNLCKSHRKSGYFIDWVCGCVSTAFVLSDTNEDDSAAVRLWGMELFKQRGQNKWKILNKTICFSCDVKEHSQ